jgi:hypothetical protein
MENDAAVRDFSFASCDEKDCPMSEGNCSVGVHIAWADFILYVDSPVPGQATIITNDDDIGHTFWEISIDPCIKSKLTPSAQNYVNQPFGYYPNGYDNKSLFQAYLTGTTSSYIVPGTLNNDSGHHWDVKKTYSLNSLSDVQTKAGYTSFLANNPGTYNLNNWNCTNAAIFVANYGEGLISITPPDSSTTLKTSWGNIWFDGISPGQLGFELWNDPDAVKNI